MQILRRMSLAALVLACCPWAARAGGVAVGVGVRVGPGFGPGFGRPYCGYPYGFYRPFPLVVGVGVYAPPPVVYAPAPVLVQPVYAAPALVTSAAPATTTEPPLAPAPAQAPPPTLLPPPKPLPDGVRAAPPAQVDTLMGQLASADERTRAEAMVQLGRLRANRAVSALSRSLTEDRSATAREAAARALGLIGDTSSLDALQTAAQADDDHDVRRSASFAADVIRSRLPR